jgi:hypothetical protein
MLRIKHLPVSSLLIMLVLADHVHKEAARDAEQDGSAIHVNRQEIGGP